VEYVDLYLIHLPVCLKPGPVVFPAKREDAMPFDFKGVWRAMEECHRLGLAKAIGVSNFTTMHLDKILAAATVPPAVNQASYQSHGFDLNEHCRKLLSIIIDPHWNSIMD
jgi:diketogulonate reductase-like aldo/keto reductase